MLKRLRVPHAWGTRKGFSILTIHVLSGIVYFPEIILENSRNIGETTPRLRKFASMEKVIMGSSIGLALHSRQPMLILPIALVGQYFSRV